MRKAKRIELRKETLALLVENVATAAIRETSICDVCSGLPACDTVLTT